MLSRFFIALLLSGNPIQPKFELKASETKAISSENWQIFKQKLADISFLDAVTNTDYMCCFATGGLNWEANIRGVGHLDHKTWCRQSVQFAEVCEYIFQFFDNPNLKSGLEGLRK